MKKEVIAPNPTSPYNQELNSHAELLLANKELAFQNQERKDRASELAIANKELAFQIKEKGKRAAELVIANKELAFQNKEKEMRAAELIIANAELTFQNQEKENRASELMIANKELAFQNKEKGKRAAELAIANKELIFQNQEKEKRAAELIIANNELIFQNMEKEKRAAELLLANKELESFNFISSHDLQEPLRKIQAFSSRILEEEHANLSSKGKYYFERSRLSALYMQTLINDLLAYSRTTVTERKFEVNNLRKIIDEVTDALQEVLKEKKATIEIGRLYDLNIIPFQFRQLLQNLMSNALKFAKPEIPPHITINCHYIKYDESIHNHFILPVDHHHIEVTDNGIGFDAQYNEKIFEIFQRLHHKKDYEGTGIGLTIVKKIVENHNGIITANGQIDQGSTFNIFIPVRQE